MRPSEVAAALAALIPTRRPVYLWGSPGVGKSSVVRHAAESLSLDLVDVRATLLDPVDLRGLPTVLGGRAEWCPPAFLPRGGKGVLFLDELAQAPPLVQAACLQLVLDRRVGEYELPDGWSVVAASNRAEDRAGTHRLISPLLNRFVHLDLEVSADVRAAAEKASAYCKKAVTKMTAKLKPLTSTVTARMRSVRTTVVAAARWLDLAWRVKRAVLVGLAVGLAVLLACQLSHTAASLLAGVGTGVTAAVVHLGVWARRAARRLVGPDLT